MRRYWIPQIMFDDQTQVRLSGEVLHHVRDVCRQRVGAKFEVLSEDGRAHLVEIMVESKKESIARILESRVIAELPRPHLELILSIPRFAVFEAILEKSVELGVHSIIPVYSDFSFIRRQDDVLAKKRPRFEKIIVGATQQSGRGDLLKLEAPCELDKFLQTFNQAEGASGMFAYEGDGEVAAREALQQLSSRQPQKISIFVGSEGGFSDREVELFRHIGLKSVTLGGQVLRVETACVALVSVIKYAFDLMR